MGRALGLILSLIVGLFLLLYIIGLTLPDDGRSAASGGRYRSFSHCMTDVQTPAMLAGAESNAPAINYCRNWRDYR